MTTIDEVLDHHIATSATPDAWLCRELARDDADATAREGYCDDSGERRATCGCPVCLDGAP